MGFEAPLVSHFIEGKAMSGLLRAAGTLAASTPDLAPMICCKQRGPLGHPLCVHAKNWVKSVPVAL
jgi:hypothetical protein